MIISNASRASTRRVRVPVTQPIRASINMPIILVKRIIESVKKIIIVILIVGSLASAFYFIFANNLKQLKPSINIDSESIIEMSESTKISNLYFSYRTSPNGYVLINDPVNWPENIISSISLFSKRDYEWSSQPGFIGEGPPSITISVFKNPERLTAKAWADANPLVSNIELIDKPPVSVNVGGVDGVYYLVLGLYLLDTYVFAYGDEIYILSGAYHEVGDEYYKNTADVISTIVFK